MTTCKSSTGKICRHRVSPVGDLLAGTWLAEPKTRHIKLDASCINFKSGKWHQICTVLYLPLLTAYNLQQMIGFFMLLLRSLKSEEWPTGQSNAPSIVAKLYVTMSSCHIFSKLSQKIQTFKICKNMRYIGTHMFIICI